MRSVPPGLVKGWITLSQINGLLSTARALSIPSVSARSTLRPATQGSRASDSARAVCFRPCVNASAVAATTVAATATPRPPFAPLKPLPLPPLPPLKPLPLPPLPPLPSPEACAAWWNGSITKGSTTLRPPCRRASRLPSPSSSTKIPTTPMFTGAGRSREGVDTLLAKPSTETPSIARRAASRARVSSGDWSGK